MILPESPTREEALKAFALFVESFGAKYPKAVECLVKDKDDLFAFYDFPAMHWIHLRTTNPIESTFAMVRLHHTDSNLSPSLMVVRSVVMMLSQLYLIQDPAKVLNC